MFIPHLGEVEFSPSFSYNSVLILIAGAASVMAYWRGSVAKDTITVLRENNTALVDRVKLVEQDNAEMKAVMAKMQGQIETYKELPLQELATGISQIVTSNAQILSVLTTPTPVTPVTPPKKR